MFIRKSVAFFLLFSLTLQCLGSLGVFAWFEVNRSYIAQALCENKERPWLHCDGQCVLMKKLRKLEDQHKKEHQKIEFSKTEFSITFPDGTMLCNPEIYSLIDNPLPPYQSAYRYNFADRPFLPPKLTVI